MIRRALIRVWQVILKALKQGMTTRGMALTLAMGVVLSIFPVYGITTLLCLLVAVIFRLNIVVLETGASRQSADGWSPHKDDSVQSTPVFVVLDPPTERVGC